MVDVAPHKSLEVYETFPEDEPMDIEDNATNPQEPLFYIPLTQSREDMTPEMRLAQLTTELDDLDREIPILTKDSEPVARELGDLTSIERWVQRFCADNYRGTMTASDFNDILKESLIQTMSGEAETAYEVYQSYPVDTSKEEMQSSLSAIDKRLRDLEIKIGSPTETIGNYIHCMKILKGQIRTFDPKKIDEVNLQAEVVNNELEMINQLKDKVQSVDSETVDKLYSWLMKTYKLQNILPAIIDKLTQLKTLHEETIQFNDRVSFLEKQQTEIKQKIAEQDTNQLTNEWNAIKVECVNALK